MFLLDRYVEVAAFRAIVMVGATLTALFSLLEFVEQLASVGQGHYRVVDALLFVLLTVPARLLQVTPVSMLLGCLLSLGALSRNFELTALRCLGVSESRIVGAVFRLAVPILIGLFLMAEFVIPPAQQLAQSQRLAALSSSSSLRSGDGFWAQRDNQYLYVGEFEYGNIPKNIDIYEFTPDGSLKSLIHADTADAQADGTWILGDVSRKLVNAGQFQTEHLASLSWRSFIPTQLLILPPESMPPIALWRYVHDLKQRHQQATRFEQELWSKISIPFSIAAMIMIAAPFVFGPPRAQNNGQQIAIGALFGIVFTLCQQITRYLALLYGVDPAVSALAPSLLLMSLAIFLFGRLQR
jgi:lipopolysaccharide export system permease protein